MKKIGLIVMVLSLFAQAEFERTDNDLTVIDNETKLEWQDSYEEGKFTTYVIGTAIRYCEGLSLDDKDDWRLPNINELKTLIVETQYAPTIDGKFEKIANGKYWSSTSGSYYSSTAWIVNFSNGYVGNSHKTYNYYVRCVRAGQ